jgi:tritrans,polycis-undecaprenyl-diphosphate synthase [geranylgeranyl-diphosphate specific]
MPLPHIVSDAAYSKYESQLKKEVMAYPVPNHIGIIMDGNRRYAQEVLNASAEEGHLMGRDKLDEVIHWCLDIGVRHLTVYAFSTENFNRDPDEVEYIMEMIAKSLHEFADSEEVHRLHVGVKLIGDREMLSDVVLEAVDYAEEKTKGYTDLVVYMAIAYGGRQELTNATRQIASKVKSGELDVDDITEDLISSYMWTRDTPDPDLILRTSGEVRISNFLLWQMAYSELYFTDVYWPGFRFIDLLRAVRTYQQRKRRYGV